MQSLGPESLLVSARSPVCGVQHGAKLVLRLASQAKIVTSAVMLRIRVKSSFKEMI